jgi:hypothetical protein
MQFGDPPPTPSPEPVSGWRFWDLVVPAVGPPELQSVLYDRNSTWPALRPSQADCRARRLFRWQFGVPPHLAPDARCTCGIYAVAWPGALAMSAVPLVSVIGSVSMWGQLVEHQIGYRAEFAYPTRLTLVCCRCIQRGKGGRPPEVVVDRGPGFPTRAFCEEHDPRRTWYRRSTLPVHDALQVRSALLASYLVDLLPFEAVQPTLERNLARSTIGG